MRPQLYFQDYFDKQHLNELIFEALCHAFDEYLDGNCSAIVVTVGTKTCSIQYNAGMSLVLKTDGITRAEGIMTQLYTCSNLKKHLEVGEEFCKLGMATVNAACTNCQLSTVWNQQQATFDFEHGKTVRKVIEPVADTDNFTLMKLQPDPVIFGNITFEPNRLYTKIEEMSTRLNSLKFIIQNPAK